MSQLPKVYVDKPSDEFLPEQDCPATDPDTIVQCVQDAARFVFVSSDFVSCYCN